MAGKSTTTKKTVQVTTQTTEADEPKWTPSPEERSQANKFRFIAAALWAVALAAEAVAIFWALKQDPFDTKALVILIALIVVDAGTAIAGSLLWKKANRLDPASRKETVRFFIQNQLGAFITAIAFIPLIVLIILNKNMSGTQKGIVGGIAGALFLVAMYFGIDWNPVSQEQYNQEETIVLQYTGSNQVYWVKNGSVYHLCQEYPPGTTIAPLNMESKDNQIYTGTVAQAHAAGMERLSARGFAECGFTEGQPAYPDLGNQSGSSASASATSTP
jgi:hypothetical protein